MALWDADHTIPKLNILSKNLTGFKSKFFFGFWVKIWISPKNAHIEIFCHNLLTLGFEFMDKYWTFKIVCRLSRVSNRVCSLLKCNLSNKQWWWWKRRFVSFLIDVWPNLSEHYCHVCPVRFKWPTQLVQFSSENF